MIRSIKSSAVRSNWAGVPFGKVPQLMAVELVRSKRSTSLLAPLEACNRVVK